MKKAAILAGVLLLALLTLFALKEKPEPPGEAEPPASLPTPVPTVSATPRPTAPPPVAEPSPTPTEDTPPPAVTGGEARPPEPTAPPPVLTPPPAVTPTAPPPTRPGDGAVLDAYFKAETAYAWFERVPLPTVEETVEIDGTVYNRVDYPGITSLMDLRFYLKTCFSDEMVDELMVRNTPRYTDVNGALYAVAGGRGSDVTKGGETSELLWEGDQRCVVQMTVEILDPEQNFAITGTEVHRFPYEKVGDQWIFTSFYLFR